MGLDVYANLVVGVPYHKIVIQENETTTVAKYNENTGQPYAKEIKNPVVRFGNTVKPLADWKESLYGELPEGLRAF